MMKMKSWHWRTLWTKRWATGSSVRWRVSTLWPVTASMRGRTDDLSSNRYSEERCWRHIKQVTFKGSEWCSAQTLFSRIDSYVAQTQITRKVTESMVIDIIIGLDRSCVSLKESSKAYLWIRSCSTEDKRASDRQIWLWWRRTFAPMQ